MNSPGNRCDRTDATRVLLVSPLPPPVGGIATWTQALLRESSNHAAVRIRHIDIAIRWRKASNTALLLRVAGGSIQAVRDTLRVLIAILSFRPHVLHLTSTARFSSIRDVGVLLIARLFGAYGVLHYRISFSPEAFAGGWQARAALLAMRLAGAVLVLDGRTHDLLRGRLPRKEIVRMPNLIDLQEIDGLAAKVMDTIPAENARQEGTRLVFVGMLLEWKGVEDLVRACSQLPPVQLHFVGEFTHSDRHFLEQLSADRVGAPWLHFHGVSSREEVVRQILLSDILVLPSRRDEGFPNVVLEAMALRKPVVVSDVGAMAEMIDVGGPDPCGACVAPSNVESLRVAMERMLNQPESWIEMGRAGRARVERIYSADAVLKELIARWTAAR